MPRLNNKDYTVEELERLISLMNDIISHATLDENDFLKVDEVGALLKGTTFGNDGAKEPNPIAWNFTFKLGMQPKDMEQSRLIMNAMRSSEVNENIKRRFSMIAYEELNRYQNRIDVLMMRGDSNILE